MTEEIARGACPHTEQVSLLVLCLLPRREAEFLREHLERCHECRAESDTFQLLAASLACQPADLLRPSDSFWERLVARIGINPGNQGGKTRIAPWTEPDWEEVAPGIACKLLAADEEHHRVSMLVRLAPGAEYPPHRHAGTEELHLLQGELWIDDRKLVSGDYNRAHAGTADMRVWSETGCTCVLMTSTQDVLR